jgi:lipopolysaccharide/colanic/teichoic acid biosynthesis glycosyltransferase
MDVIISFFAGLVSLIAYPFIILAIKMNDGGRVFIIQERVGKNGVPIKIYKFRTMTANDNGVYIDGRTTNIVTKVGAFLRRTRLDELPQLLNVLRGELSLIGPRPELPSLVREYEKEIPYYGIRHLTKPGLSGWAQIYHENHPHHGVAVEETKEKLSYDLFYIKNRSFVLDVTIALKTINKLLSRSGV